ncbi:MAG: hypothetical protein AVDCRST_MAG68-1571, partial [uncultured Gemmatimonadetes bacterium]
VIITLCPGRAAGVQTGSAHRGGRERGAAARLRSRARRRALGAGLPHRRDRRRSRGDRGPAWARGGSARAAGRRHGRRRPLAGDPPADLRPPRRPNRRRCAM